MDKLSALLPRTLHKHNLSDEALAAQIVSAANAWLDKQNIADVCALSFKQKTVSLATSSSAAAQEVYSVQEELMEALEQKFPNQLKRIHIMREKSANPV